MPDEHEDPKPSVLSRLGGWGFFEPFTKYGLLGCCVGALVMMLILSQRSDNDLQAQLLVLIADGNKAHLDSISKIQEAEQERAKEDRKEIKESMRALWQARQDEIKASRELSNDIRTVLDEVKGTRRTVGELKKTVEGKEP